MKIYSIKNEKIGFFNRPIYCESPNEALTYVQNVLSSDADRALLHLKDDLALYELGSIDFTTGIIDSYEEPLIVCTLHDIFATIPTDVIPRNEKQIISLFEDLRSRVDTLDVFVKKLDSFIPAKWRK